jgi:hypothetical protein
MSMYRNDPEGLFDALVRDGWDVEDLVFVEDRIFTQETYKEWAIELEVMCGGCEHMTEDHQPVGEGWSVCVRCPAPHLLQPSGFPQGCVWRYEYGGDVRDYLAAVASGIESPDAYRYRPQ